MPYSYPKYPTAIFDDTDYPNVNDDITWVKAWLVNALKEELQAALTELGTNPKGDYDDVKARLDYLESGTLLSGIIAMWKGSIATIPNGWVLCNGANGTPDLRDKFIVGAKQDDSGVAKTNITGSLTQTGGAVSHSHGVGSYAGSSHTHGRGNLLCPGHTHNPGTYSASSHVLTTTEMPSHNHNPIREGGSNLYAYDGTFTSGGSYGRVGRVTWSATERAVVMQNTGGGIGHTHVISGASASKSVWVTGTTSGAAVTITGSSASVNHLPSYYALAFIMKT